MKCSVAYLSTVILSAVLVQAKRELHDPLNIFCGATNCYEILGIDRDASDKAVRKAYRKLSLEYHPDKVDKTKVANATETFRLISKAYEVLNGNESRPLFDYYLDHPWDYFKVSGRHMYRNMPKSDVRFIILVVIGLISWLMHAVQLQKYERVIKYLKNAVANNLNERSGGTKQTMELYRQVVKKYEAEIQKAREDGDKKAGKGIKPQKDPLFLKLVDEAVAGVKVEGGYRKPEWKDLFIYQLAVLPVTSYNWAVKYHRRFISSVPLSLEERTEMAQEAVGLGTWDVLSEEERQELIERQIWRSEVKSKWLAEVNGENVDGSGDDDQDDDDDESPVATESVGKDLKARLSGKDKKKKKRN